MKLNDLFNEADVVDFQKFKQRKRMPDDVKYNVAVAKQLGIDIPDRPTSDIFDPEDYSTVVHPDRDEDDFFTRLSKRTPKGGEAPGWDYDEEEASESLNEAARMAWARKGTKIVRKYRCVSGHRKGRIVATPSQCAKPPDVKKRLKLKQTKARMGPRMTRKSKRTKRLNPASRRLTRLNIRGR